MYINRAPDGSNNICGKKIRVLRKSLVPKISQRMLAERIQLLGYDMDKNTIQRIESGERFVTDIEIRILAKVLAVSYAELLNGELN